MIKFLEQKEWMSNQKSIDDYRGGARTEADRM